METTKKSIGSSIWRLNETLYAVNEELMENGGEVTPEIEEALTKAEMTQVQIADGLHDLIAKSKAEDAFLAEEIKRLQGLKKARANAIEGLKRYLMNYMIANDVQKIEGEYCKVSIAAGRETAECDEEGLLAQYDNKVDELLAELPPYITIEPKVSRSALLKYLQTDGCVIPTVKEGQVDVPLANIVRNPYLLIK